MTAAYELNNVVFSYGACPVLSLKRLEIAPGEIVALVGPNGSGKTTLLHLLAFVERPQNGSIGFFGEESRRDNLIAFRRRVGLLLQNPYLFHASVPANLTWGLKIRGVSGEQAKKAAREALAVVGLSGFEDRHARALSGGETQRVALARALVLEPEVLLLDEPANHMDRESVQRNEEIVTELNRNRRTTVVLTTHNPATARTVAHRVLYLVDGDVVHTSIENLFRGRLMNGGTVFATDKMVFRIPPGVTEGRFLTVDPEGITISPQAEGDLPENTFVGVLASLCLEGNKVKASVDAGEVFHVTLNENSDAAGGLRLGSAVRVNIPAESMRVF